MLDGAEVFFCRHLPPVRNLLSYSYYLDFKDESSVEHESYFSTPLGRRPGKW